MTGSIEWEVRFDLQLAVAEESTAWLRKPWIDPLLSLWEQGVQTLIRYFLLLQGAVRESIQVSIIALLTAVSYLPWSAKKLRSRSGLMNGLVELTGTNVVSEHVRKRKIRIQWSGRVSPRVHSASLSINIFPSLLARGFWTWVFSLHWIHFISTTFGREGPLPALHISAREGAVSSYRFSAELFFGGWMIWRSAILVSR